MDKASRIIAIVALVVAVIAGVIGSGVFAKQPTETFTPQGVTNFGSITLDDDLIVGGDSTLTDDVAVGGDLDVTGDIQLGANDLYPLEYTTAGSSIVCGTTIITGTGAIPHTLSTPVVVVVSLGEDVAGDQAHVSFTNSAATVTAKVWDTALTPAASSAAVSVDWCVVGTP